MPRIIKKREWPKKKVKQFVQDTCSQCHSLIEYEQSEAVEMILYPFCNTASEYKFVCPVCSKKTKPISGRLFRPKKVRTRKS